MTLYLTAVISHLISLSFSASGEVTSNTSVDIEKPACTSSLLSLQSLSKTQAEICAKYLAATHIIQCVQPMSSNWERVHWPAKLVLQNICNTMVSGFFCLSSLPLLCNYDRRCPGGAPLTTTQNMCRKGVYQWSKQQTRRRNISPAGGQLAIPMTGWLPDWYSDTFTNQLTT